MAFILDASITGGWVFEDERTGVTESILSRLQGEMAWVPALWWFEVRNLAIMNERKGRISPTQTVAFLRQLKLPTILTDYSAHSDATLRLARTHKLTVYDAAYLELALRRKVELATLDKRLAEAAQTEGVIVVA